ncbi:hypothetical protein BVRB_8g198450 [Beta vulgaris subsp. vulgaris]|uniref:uncharacterized protein LOC104902397 n=1 Tax=Beta vulgaris subsp. vulgaris TaxID=3555 RepID=UPI0005400759|nr:uncharacterized protein LOC104902397 [Beta vulgaris subsp. vulgaris]KMT03305.1 hypothetical protein BVRB_8g198450 [Beta vulgaris subsp. vulgaris]
MANHPKDPTTPAPSIGKIGPYTVFLTPPPTPKPSSESPPQSIPQTPKKIAVKSPPPVQPPPANFEPASDRFAFLWEAISKVQNVHASVDEYMANWLGLNQSKYQWALDDYYESKGGEKGDVLTKEVSSKRQTV